MKFETPKNPGYCATVVSLKNIIPLATCDNVVGTTIFGFQAITGKDRQAGEIGIVFPAETQLSDAYCKANNLYRHAESNKDTTQKGYIEDNRRVRAIKFRGHRSDCLFMPLESLAYLGFKPKDFKEGDEFDCIGADEICCKYIVKTNDPRGNHQPQPKKFTRVDTKFIPEHFYTDNYFKNCANIPQEVNIIVTQKLHGTSVRIANTIVKRKKTIRDHVFGFLGAKIQEFEFDYVFGSRKVIKDIYNPDHQHYYSEDIWSTEGKKLKGLLPKNFVVYGELIGYTSTGAPIQVDYTYKIPLNECQLYIYRITFVNEEGLATDLSWDQIKEFCTQRGLKYVPEIFRGKHKDFDVTKFLDIRYKDEYPGCLECEEGTVDEGVCVREDRLTPYILKAKSAKFLEHETALNDKGKEDIENQEVNDAG